MLHQLFVDNERSCILPHKLSSMAKYTFNWSTCGWESESLCSLGIDF